MITRDLALSLWEVCVTTADEFATLTHRAHGSTPEAKLRLTFARTYAELPRLIIRQDWHAAEQSVLDLTPTILRFVASLPEPTYARTFPDPIKSWPTIIRAFDTLTTHFFNASTLYHARWPKRDFPNTPIAHTMPFALDCFFVVCQSGDYQNAVIRNTYFLRQLDAAKGGDRL